MPDFVIDHNVPVKVANWLIKQGHAVLRVSEQNPEMPDFEIAKLAQDNGAILLTNDRDFIELATDFPKLSVILFSFSDQGSAVRITALQKVLPELKKSRYLFLILQEN